MQNKYFKVFFGLDMALHSMILLCVAFMIYQADYYKSFAGFGSLLMLLVLVPYFVVLACAMIFLLLFMIWKKRIVLMIALVLQMLCSLLWLFVAHLLHSAVSVFELVMILQIIMIIALFLFLWEKE